MGGVVWCVRSQVKPTQDPLQPTLTEPGSWSPSCLMIPTFRGPLLFPVGAKEMRIELTMIEGGEVSGTHTKWASRLLLLCYSVLLQEWTGTL